MYLHLEHHHYPNKDRNITWEVILNMFSLHIHAISRFSLAKWRCWLVQDQQHSWHIAAAPLSPQWIQWFLASIRTESTSMPRCWSLCQTHNTFIIISRRRRRRRRRGRTGRCNIILWEYVFHLFAGHEKFIHLVGSRHLFFTSHTPKTSYGFRHAFRFT